MKAAHETEEEKCHKQKKNKFKVKLKQVFNQNIEWVKKKKVILQFHRTAKNR